MKIICFLRDLDLPIDAISQILKEEHPEKVISLLIEQQEKVLSEEVSEKQDKLEKLRELKSELKDREQFSLESIGDIAIIMEGKKKLKQMRWMMILTGLPVTALQWFSIIFWIVKGIWWPFALWVLIAIPWGILVSRYYFGHVKYICPECHEVFKPSLKEAFWANHTPTARKLTCTSCGHKGFCVEVWGGDGK
jgi:DNA-directed RNA polymerase subunit RPC12/RpoP